MHYTVQTPSQLEHNRAERRRDLYSAPSRAWHGHSPSHPSTGKCCELHLILDETGAAQVQWVGGRGYSNWLDVHNALLTLSGKCALKIFIEGDTRPAVVVFYAQLQRNQLCERRVGHCQVERSIISLDLCKERGW